MTETNHIHMWNRETRSCGCGAPVPAYLAAAWDLYSHRVDLGGGS